jgi:hypothetical protein
VRPGSLSPTASVWHTSSTRFARSAPTSGMCCLIRSGPSQAREGAESFQRSPKIHQEVFSGMAGGIQILQMSPSERGIEVSRYKGAPLRALKGNGGSGEGRLSSHSALRTGEVVDAFWLPDYSSRLRPEATTQPVCVPLLATDRWAPAATNCLAAASFSADFAACSGCPGVGAITA